MSRLRNISIYLILILMFEVSCAALKAGKHVEKQTKRGNTTVQCDPLIVTGEVSQVSQILSSRRFEGIDRIAPCNSKDVLKAIHDEACKLNANKVFLQEVVESDDEGTCFQANAIFTQWEPSSLLYASKSDSGKVAKKSSATFEPSSILTIYADENINREYFESYYRDQKFKAGPVFKVISVKELNDRVTSKKVRFIRIYKKFGIRETFTKFSLFQDRITSGDGKTIYFKDIEEITVFNKESRYLGALANFIFPIVVFSTVGGYNYLFGENFPVKPMMTLAVGGGFFGLLGWGKPSDYHTIYFVVHTPK